MEESIPTRYVFMMMLAIADPKGYVIGTDIAIARRINLTVDEFQKALKPLMAPDEHSNSKEFDGRRVIQSDGERGYYLVNYLTYKGLFDEDGRRSYMREYMRERRLKEKGLDESVSVVNVNGKQSLAALTQGEGEEEVKEEERKEAAPPSSPDFFLQVWNSCSAFSKIRSLTENRRRAWKARMSDQFFRENWQTAFQTMQALPFCLGQNARGWKADADWFLKPDSVARIMEGKYGSSEPEVKESPDLALQAPEDRDWTIAQEFRKRLAQMQEVVHEG